MICFNNCVDQELNLRQNEQEIYNFACPKNEIKYLKFHTRKFQIPGSTNFLPDFLNLDSQ